MKLIPNKNKKNKYPVANKSPHLSKAIKKITKENTKIKEKCSPIQRKGSHGDFNLQNMYYFPRDKTLLTFIHSKYNFVWEDHPIMSS